MIASAPTHSATNIARTIQNLRQPNSACVGVGVSSSMTAAP
jgi:hypothetical protein